MYIQPVDPHIVVHPLELCLSEAWTRNMVVEHIHMTHTPDVRPGNGIVGELLPEVRWEGKPWLPPVTQAVWTSCRTEKKE